MYEAEQSLPGETDDLKVAKFYALGGAGMHQWLGIAPGFDPANAEALAQTAKDTENYLLTRPATSGDTPGPDEHYDSTLEVTSLRLKTARVLVEEWAQAELREDRTAANDVFDELTERAVRRAKLIKHRRALDRDHDVAATLNTLYDRKERLKPKLAVGWLIASMRTDNEKGGKEPDTEPERGSSVDPPLPPAAPFASIPIQKKPPPASRPPAETLTDEEIPADFYQLWPHRRPKTDKNVKKPNPLSQAWWTAGGTIGAWLAHPEKGRRRQIIATLGMYAAVGTAAWLLGHPPNEHHQTAATSLPPQDTTPHPPAFNQAFTDNLKPEDYEGQTYEWGAVADDYGAANATSELSEMIKGARAQGAHVGTWGDAGSGHWGISDVTVYFPDGSQKSYYDTPHKLALLQYLSKLNGLDEDSDSSPN